MHRFSLLLSALLVFVNTSHADIVIKSDDRQETRYIKVIESGKNVGFRLCDKRDSRCDIIGKEEFYSKAALSRKVKVEYARMAGVTLLDAGLAVIGLAGGAYAGVISIAGHATATGLGTAVAGGAIIGVTVTEAIALSMKTLNPFTYVRSARIVGKSLKSGNQISRNFEKDLLSLENALSDIEG